MSNFYNTIEAVLIYLIVLSFIPEYDPPEEKTTCHKYGCVCFKDK